MGRKKVKKEVIQKQKLDIKGKFLTEIEMLKIEKFDANFYNFQKDIQNKKLCRDNLMTQIELLEMKISQAKMEIGQIDKELSEFHSNIKSFAEKRKQLVRPVRDRLNLPDKFGYDMETREVILD